jgi:hypothetical protein
VILPHVDTRPTYEAMRRGEWPEPSPQVAAAWARLRRMEFGEQEAKVSDDERESKDSC